MPPTIEQQRAKHAWDQVKMLCDDKKIGREAKKLPTRIITAGLGQSLAFLDAKKETPALLEALNDWTNKRIPENPGQNGLLQRIIDGDSEFLRRVTDEVMAYMQWYVRFAEAKGLCGSD